MKKLLFLALISISLQAFSTNWLGWGYKGFNSGIPSTWSQEHINGTSNWVTYGGLYTPYEGSGNAYFSTLVSQIGDTTMLVSQAFSNIGTTNSLFTFWHKQQDFGGNNNELAVYYRTSSTSSWILLENYTAAFNNWTQELVMLPQTSATIQLGFRAVLKGGSSSQGVALDIVSIMYLNNTCSFPINVNVDTTTNNSATIIWEESGSATTWDMEYGAYGFTQGSGTAVNGINTTPTYTIPNLSSGSQYDVYVRASCASSQTSDWVGPITFFTECNTITSFPYEETFDNSNFDDDDWNIGFTVNCWTEEAGDIAQPTTFTGANSDWKPGEFGVPTDYNPTNSNAAMTRFSYGSSWLISPTFDLGTTHNYQLEFDIALTYYTSSGTSYTLSGSDTVAVVISTDNGQTWNKSNILTYWDAITNPSEITTSGIHKIVDLGAYSNEVKVAFYVSGSSGSAGYLYIDNVKIKTFNTSPELEVLTPVWNAGPQLINATDTSGLTLKIRNSGLDTLYIDSITDLSSTEFTSNFNTSIGLDSGEVYTFSFEYTPTDLVDDSLPFIIYTAYGVDTVVLTGTAYDLAPCEVEIGTDVQEVNLPINFLYHNSYSQSIYLQSEINRTNQQIHKIYFYYNGYNQFANKRNFTIYMKQTSQTALTGWEDISTFDSLSTVALDLVAEGWYEIDLADGFNHNSDNIIIAVTSSIVNAQSFSKQEMFSHNAPNGALMSIVTYSDGNIDLVNPPIISPIAFRPNIRFCMDSNVGIVNSNENNKELTIYPNPASNNLTISHINSSISEIEIIDITGKRIKQLPTNNAKEVTINVADLSNGIYIIRIGNDFQKFIKK